MEEGTISETPETAVQNLAFLIGYVGVHLNQTQHDCAVESLVVLARKAGVPEAVIRRALHPTSAPIGVIE